MKIAITGASGHAGGNLVRLLLSQGEEVRALVRSDTRAIEGLDVERIIGDLNDKDSLVKAFSGVEQVYHLAAHITIDHDKGNIAEATNSEGTKNVVEACLECGVKRLVHFSSVHALAQDPFDKPIDETRELALADRWLPYDRSKAKGELQIMEGIKRGLDAVIVNPSSIIGPHDYKPSRMGEVVIDLCNRSLPSLVEGGYDWVDVRDVCEGAVAAMKRGRTGERYLLTGCYRTVKEFAAIVEEISGVKAPRFVCPIWLARAGVPFARLYSMICGTRPLYTQDSLDILSGNNKFATEKAEKELGYKARPLEETLRDTIEWFKEAGMIK